MNEPMLSFGRRRDFSLEHRCGFADHHVSASIRSTDSSLYCPQQHPAVNTARVKITLTKPAGFTQPDNRLNSTGGGRGLRRLPDSPSQVGPDAEQ